MMQTQLLTEPIQLVIPHDASMLQDERTLKDWIWQNNQNLIWQALMSSSSSSLSSCASATFASGSEQTACYEERYNLLTQIAKLQQRHLFAGNANIVYSGMLEGILRLLNAGRGFVAEIKKAETNGNVSLKMHTMLSIQASTGDLLHGPSLDTAWCPEENTLSGRVFATKSPVLCNSPISQHFLLEGYLADAANFLAIPIFQVESGEVIGMIGVCDKQDDFIWADVDFLEPFAVIASNLIQTSRLREEKQFLSSNLEWTVRERTRKLELENHCLAEANRRALQASNVQLQQFASMSHEIRTPLSCIIGMSSVLCETDLTPMQSECIDMIVTSGNLLLSVVNDVLDYSKLITGNVTLEVQRSSLQDTLDAIVHSIETKARSNDLSLRTFYDMTVPEIYETDCRRLQQILYNLLGNAIKFGKPGTEIELAVTIVDTSNRPDDVTHVPMDTKSQSIVHLSNPPDDFCRRTSSIFEPIASTNYERNKQSFGLCEPDQLTKVDHPAKSPRSRQKVKNPKKSPSGAETLSQGRRKHESPDSASTTSKENGTKQKHATTSYHDGNKSNDAQVCSRKMLRFVVKDYGQGIHSSEFENIFQPFRQAGSDLERNQEGTGLGLAITANLVKAMGGRISVDSEVGKWSEFTVDLPFDDERTNLSMLTGKLRGVNVVLIDKDDKNTAQLSQIFKDTDVAFRSFHSLEELIKCLGNDFVKLHERTVCMIQEDLYDQNNYNIVAAMVPASLMTFGPRYSVDNSVTHYRSLVHLLPCVLLESIAACATHGKPRKRSLSFPTSIADDSLDKAVQNLRVLVAEDNLVNQKVLSRMLRRIGVNHFDVVENGKMAVDQTAVVDYDVVLMDMEMPVMDGIEACRIIVARPGVGSSKKPKIVFVTAHVSLSFEVRCKQAGGWGFLPKPFKLDTIQQCLKNVAATKECITL